MAEPHRWGRVHCHVETAIAAVILALVVWLFMSNRNADVETRHGPSQSEVEDALHSGR